MTPRTDREIWWVGFKPDERLEAVWADFARDLEKENAELRKVLAEADELERYSNSNGERQWGRCSAWLHPDDAVIIVSAKALDAARKEAQL
jgi:hypothetical protein